MKKDPFADLAGLDQKLFQSDPSAKEATKQRDNETTLARDNEQTSGRSNDQSKLRRGDASLSRSHEPSIGRRIEATRTRTSSLGGQENQPRAVERHSHDIFKDQIRWMNRTKLEIEERYGVRVTSNALVKLAIDVVRNDYQRSRSRSVVVRVLVEGRDLDTKSNEEEGEG
jgi:hypothetical protein